MDKILIKSDSRQNLKKIIIHDILENKEDGLTTLAMFFIFQLIIAFRFILGEEGHKISAYVPGNFGGRL